MLVLLHSMTDGEIFTFMKGEMWRVRKGGSQGMGKHIKCAQASRAMAAAVAKMAHYAVLLLHIICMAEEAVKRIGERKKCICNLS